MIIPKIWKHQSHVPNHQPVITPNKQWLLEPVVAGPNKAGMSEPAQAGHSGKNRQGNGNDEGMSSQNAGKMLTTYTNL